MKDFRQMLDQLQINRDIRDAFYHHSLRVMYLSAQLGRHMGVHDRNLRLAALLHDIGKIGIAPEIILSPLPLTPMEYTIVQSHCHIGNVICRKLFRNPSVARYVRDHHERWDGTGYPRGLEGEEISLEARIISVCDVFDTLVFEKRHYRRKEWTVSEALVELRRCSWTQFDGNVVKEFIAMVRARPNLFGSSPDVERNGARELEGTSDYPVTGNRN